MEIKNQNRYVGYLRVSSDKQDAESQRFEIEQWASKNQVTIGEWIEETVSGKKSYAKRDLGSLLVKMQKGDVLIASEISRIGRNMFDVFSCFNLCIERGLTIRTLKDCFVLEDTLTSRVLGFAFGMAAEIERQLISQRTKQALQLKKNQGIRLGAKPKSENGIDIELIKMLYSKGLSYRKICEQANVGLGTVSKIIKNSNIKSRRAVAV